MGFGRQVANITETSTFKASASTRMPNLKGPCYVSATEDNVTATVPPLEILFTIHPHPFSLRDQNDNGQD